LYEDTWYDHIVTHHPEMDRMDDAVFSVLTAPTLVTQGAAGQLGYHNYVFTNHRIRSLSGRAPLVVIVDPVDAVVCTALYHAGRRIMSGEVMVAAVQHRTASLTADYDRVADVLYVSVGEPRPGFGDDGPDDIILRYDRDDHHPPGVTVPGFQENGWAGRKQALAAIIAHHVGVVEAEAQDIIASAIVLLRQFLSNALKSRSFLTHYAFP
jgi:hypothetical protein